LGSPLRYLGGYGGKGVAPLLNAARTAPAVRPYQLRGADPPSRGRFQLECRLARGRFFRYSLRMFKGLIDWYLGALKTCGPTLIGLMMAMESTIVPLPSEFIIPPAAHLAYTGQNPKLSLASIIIAGTLGSWIGATIL
jgi:hypothetical protein